ncbi:MAG: AbrB family transcriptional regulator [Candidatus Puniceispirillaceae bacterium]
MDPRLLLIFLSGFVGGTAAFVIGAPMPFMLGGIFGAASFVLWYERGGSRLPRVTRWVRLVFMAIIGSMIGSRFSPELLVLLPQFWLSGLLLLPFILVSHAGSYAIMRRFGRYESRDAYFASLPGGIVDSIALAEQAGADVRIVTAQHFTRIILVVTSVPLLFLLVEGEVVGSLAGETLATANYSARDVGLILGIAAAGLTIGTAVRLPVAHMMGPLFLTLSLTVTGVVEIEIPPWMGHLAQFMVGTALGSQFTGMSRRLLIKGLRYGLIVGVYMLAVGSGMAWVLTHYVPADFGVLFVSFAAGGLAEMSLIALSLNFNPVVVALHHLGRIVLTIWVGHFLARHVFKLSAKD